MSIYPWQQSQWQQLWSAHNANRLPHALMLTGIAGTGKTLFADVFANALLCTQTKDSYPCGECHGCRMVAGGAHPNKMTVVPEKVGTAIKVDQIREVSEFIQQTALIGERRVVIIQHANNMNMSAANALLKTLEEPANGALLILVSDGLGQLPATIMSRCQRIIFPRPNKELALQWLEAQLKSYATSPELLLSIAQGAPFKALLLTEEKALAGRKLFFDALCQQEKINPVALATELDDIELLDLFDYFLSFVVDLLRLKLGAEIAVNLDYQQAFASLQSRVEAEPCVDMLNHLQRLRGQAAAGFNFNRQLVVESVLLQWRGLVV